MTARRHPVPDAALDDRLGFVGTAGTGKTYNAMGSEERVLDRGGRIIHVDPLGVAWGFRLMADGRTASPYDMAIFGGAHADLPLTEGAGGLIGETIAGMKESAILDLSGLGTKAAERRFMLDCLKALYRHASGEPVHLVVDEADLFAPQQIRDKEGGTAPQLLSMMETIVRRGRIKGFIPWLITQRPAVLNKDVLSQVDGLVAFKLTSSQDRKQLGEWILGQADQDEGRRILARLPEKHVGEAVVWVPGRGVLVDATFPPKKTFDSSRTPKRGEKRKATALKPLDITTLKERLAIVEAEQQANDPRALKGRIAELERQLADPGSGSGAGKRPTDGGQVADPAAIAAARAEGFEAGRDAGFDIGFARGMLDGGGDVCFRFEQRLQSTIKELLADIRAGFEKEGRDNLAVVEAENKEAPTRPGRHAAGDPPPAPPWQGGGPVAAGTPAPRPAILSGASNEAAKSDAGSLPTPLQKIVDAVAWWNVLGVPEPSYPQVAFRAGYSAKGGTFNRYLSELRSRDLILTGQRRMSLRTEGERLAGMPDAPPDANELRTTILGAVDGPLRRILEPLMTAWPNGMAREALGAASGYEASGGTFNRYLSSLRSLELVAHGPDRTVVAQDWMFP